MNDQSVAPAAAEDVAWASINTPLGVEELKSFCRDIERMYRINPLLNFKKWEAAGENRYLFSGQNISQEEPFDFDLELTVEEKPDGFQIHYQGDLRSSTTFTIEAAAADSPGLSKLTITDRYDGVSEEERKKQLHRVDRSIVIWAKYLQQFLYSWKRWSRFRPWRWYMRRVWQPMKPSGRRITYMLLWISVFEVALILLGVVIYYLEYA